MGDAAKVTCNKKKIGRMIEVVEWKFRMRGRHVGGIGLDQNSIRRE